MSGVAAVAVAPVAAVVVAPVAVAVAAVVAGTVEDEGVDAATSEIRTPN